MGNFQVKRTVTTKKPIIKVNAGLPAGSHRFQLVVEDSRGNRSEPSQVVVNIVNTRDRRGPIGRGNI